ncbi:hypothetical protein CHUAL_001587 [Chamberlinius hualienensis]
MNIGKMKILNRSTITWILVMASIVIIQGERCFEDDNCKDGEFCGHDQYNVVTICKPCLICRDYYRDHYSKKNGNLVNCVKEIQQCGLCVDGFELAFDVEGGVLPHCVPIPPPKVDSGLLVPSDNDTLDLSDRLKVNVSEETNPENSKTAGMIAGGVVLGCVALAAVIFGSVFGYKYYHDKKIIKRQKRQNDDKKTSEFHELNPQQV